MTKPATGIKLTKCKICRTGFKKLSISHKTCSPLCAIALVLAEKEKKSRKADRVTRERLKTRQEWLRDAQSAFNKFVRERDKDQPCICCGKLLPETVNGGGYDCGHYRSVGSAPHLRFDPLNAHGQTKQCNRWGSGRAVDYRLGLIQRIGLDAVEELEADQTVKKYSIEELQVIQKLYREKYKALLSAPVGA